MESVRMFVQEKKKIGEVNVKLFNYDKGEEVFKFVLLRRANTVAEARWDELGRAAVRLVKSNDEAGFN